MKRAMRAIFTGILAICIAALGGVGFAEEAERVFTIGSVWSTPVTEQFDYAVAKTKEEFPDVKFEFMEFDVSRKFVNALKAGETGCDVLTYFNIDGVGAREYYRMGAFADLSNYPRIMDAYGQLIDIKPLFSIDGGVYAMPQDTLYANVFEVNTELFAKYGLEIPADDWTWDDFFALGEQVSALRQNGENVYLLLDDPDHAYLKQYNQTHLPEGSIDYRNEAYQAGLEKWKAAAKSGLFHTFSGTETDDMANALLVCNDSEIHSNISYGDITCIPLPRLEAGTKNIFDTRMAVMLSGTQNEDIAEAFLANLISCEALSKYQSLCTLGFLPEDMSTIAIDSMIEELYA